LTGLAAVCFAARGIGRLRHPTLWAEDGVIFFTQVHTLGVRSVIKPYAGYIHVIPRLVSLALLVVPLSAPPEAYEVVAVAISLAMLAAVLSPRLDWLLPSPTVRALTFLIICVLPGDWEAYGNVANLIFFGGISLAFLALSDDPRSARRRVWELGLILLLGLSGPDVALVLPLFAYRVWRLRSRHSWEALTLALVTAVVQYDIFLHSNRFTADTGNVGTVVRELLERVVGALLVGDSSTAAAWTNDHLAVFAAAWLVLLAVATTIALRGVAAVLGTMVLVTLVPASYVYGSIGFTYVNLERQYMLPRILLVVMVVAAAARGGAVWRRRSGDADRVRVVALVCLLCCSVGVVHDFRIPRHRTVSDTARFLHCLQTTSGMCRMDISPSGWVVKLDHREWR